MESGQIKKLPPRGFYQNVDKPELCLEVSGCDVIGICIVDGVLGYVHFMTWLCDGWWGKYRQIERIECKIIEKTS